VITHITRKKTKYLKKNVETKPVAKI